MSGRPEAITIQVGDHIQWHLFGFVLNGDTITSTLIAGAILIGLGLWVRVKASVGKPSGLQLFFETVTEEVDARVEASLGLKTAPFVVPLAMTLFLFILTANWLALIPTGHHPEYAPPPASDVNFTYALAVIVIGALHITGIRKKGLRGFYGHLFRKPYALVPLNIIEEVMKPITLALRLFGNIFSGVIMVSLIALFPAYILWAPEILWKVFDAAIGLIQAFIFALLTVLYFGAVAPAEQGAHH
jgi:F-type H+-transporting ATPase subunit a